MIKATINGKTLSIETRWEEVSFKKYLALCKCEQNTAAILGVLLDYPQEVMAKAQFEGLEAVLTALSFLNKVPVLDETPRTLGQYELPKLTEGTVEQFETLKAKIVEAANKTTTYEQNEYLPLYAAIYLQPVKDAPIGKKVGEFDLEKSELFAKQLMDFSCTEVMSAGAFFMLKGLNLMPNSPKNYRLPPILRRKRQPGLSGLMRHLVSTLRSIWSRAMWAHKTRKSYAGQSKSSIRN